MGALDLMMAASVSAADKLYVDDVFSAYLRTGTGADVTVSTGIDMTKGYMLWSKGRSVATDHAVYDSARGVTLDLVTNSTAAQTTQAAGLKSATNGSHTIGSLAKMNTNGATYVDWVFRKAPKFFDVVTYTGNGTSNRQITHSLGAQVGFAAVKATSTTGDWNVFHRSATGNLALNSPAAQTGSKAIVNAADASTFTVSGVANTNGVSYVAYLFAHDPSADGIIQCGSFTTDGSGNATVNIGWEPQFVLNKGTSTTSNWVMLDVMRGYDKSANDKALYSHNYNAEDASSEGGSVTETGFTVANLSASAQHIYLAIRRPNKPPTSGTQVYNAIARTGTGAAATSAAGFPVDLVITKKRSSTTLTGARFVDRLRGKANWLDSSATTSESSTTDTVAGLDSMTGIALGDDATTSAFNTNSHLYVDEFFRRAPGFFDVVCDIGTGAAHAITHNLTVSPEMIIRKSRSSATQWECWHSAIDNTEKLVLNSAAAKTTDTTAWNSSSPTTTSFTVGTGANVNASGATFVTYLFATLAGISKVGSYTGNGSSQTIDCGFGTGARFILIKATSTTGNWWIYDTARGIVAATDPALALNSTAAEVTSADAIDPNPTGFIVNQEATCSINANGVSYVFLSIA